MRQKILIAIVGSGALAAIVAFALPRLFPDNAPPIAEIEVDKTEGTAPLTVLFDGSKSSDPDGDTLEYSWEIADDAVSDERSFTHVFEDAKSYNVTLSVRDKKFTVSDVVIIRVQEQQVAVTDDDADDSPDVQPQSKVDLSFVGWSFTPRTPVRGQEVTVKVGITNQGTENAGPFRVEWWPGVNYPEPGKVWNIDGLAAGVSKTLSFTYPGYPSWYAKIATKVVIDPDGSVDDRDRSNNEWTRPISVAR